MKITESARKIFFSPEEARLRAGWRIAVQLLLMLVLTILFACPLGIVAVLKPEWLNLTLYVSTGIPVLLSVLLARRLIDRRSVVSLGLRFDQTGRYDLLVGIGIAFLQIGLIFGLELVFGWMRVTGTAWDEQSVLKVSANIIFWLLLFIAVGFYEELLSRGYHLQNLEEGTNTFWAVGLSSVVFGLAHIFNPNAGWISTLGIIAAGFFLAFGYLRTRQLWLPIGLHIGWNFFLGPVFGFPVSGLEPFHLLGLNVSGPDLITGGAFGPEAGLVGLVAQLFGVGLIWGYTRGREDNPLLSTKSD